MPRCLNQRGQPFNLLLGPDHSKMGAVEIVKVTDQSFHPRLDLKRFKHVKSDELRQITY